MQIAPTTDRRKLMAALLAGIPAAVIAGVPAAVLAPEMPYRQVRGGGVVVRGGWILRGDEA